MSHAEEPRWAEQALGALLEAPPSIPAWFAAAPSDGPTSSGWEVERMPSEAEGGVASLFLNDRAEPAPVLRPTPRPSEAEAEGSGLARLTELLERLPVRSAARLGPADVEVETPEIAPPAVWFWGDDDIYPDRVPEPPGRKRRRRR